MSRPALTCVVCPGLSEMERRSVLDAIEAKKKAFPVVTWELKSVATLGGLAIPKSSEVWLIAPEWDARLLKVHGQAAGVSLSLFRATESCHSIPDTWTILNHRLPGSPLSLSHFPHRCVIEHLSLKTPRFLTPSKRGGTNTIGFAGHCVENCHIESFLLSAHYLKRARPQTRFLIPNHGPLVSHFEAMTQEMGLKGCMLFANERDVIDQSDALFVPLNRVNHHLFIQAATAIGIPLVLDEEESTATLFRDGFDALLFDRRTIRRTGELIARLLDSASLRQSLGQNGKRRIRKLDESGLLHTEQTL